MKKQINILNATWNIKHLGNQAILLEAASSTTLLNIHKITQTIHFAQWNGITDIVPAYNSIAIFYDKNVTSSIQIIQKLEIEDFFDKEFKEEVRTHQIPVCFEEGLDWNEVEDLAKLDRIDFIKQFTKKKYTVAMLGFIPGFIYLNGLEKALHCPRKQNPRLKIPAGSVGIGGSQTGIYALESPGGWQIIGQTPTILFNKKQLPPTLIQPLDKVQFYAISHEEFQEIAHEVD